MTDKQKKIKIRIKDLMDNSEIYCSRNQFDIQELIKSSQYQIYTNKGKYLGELLYTTKFEDKYSFVYKPKSKKKLMENSEQFTKKQIDTWYVYLEKKD